MPSEVLTVGRAGVDVLLLRTGVGLAEGSSFGRYLGGSPTDASAAAQCKHPSVVVTKSVTITSGAEAARRQGSDPAVSGASTCHRHSGLRTLPLKPNEAHSLSTGGREFLVLPLTGTRTVTTDGSAFELTSRTDVFASTTDSDSAYLSRSSEALISSADGRTFALPAARTERSSLSARYGPKENVPVELSGAGASSRQVDNHCLPGTVGALDKAMAVVDANPYCRQQRRLAHRLR